MKRWFYLVAGGVVLWLVLERFKPRWRDGGLFILIRPEGEPDATGVKDAALWAKLPHVGPGAPAYFAAGDHFSRGDYTF